MEFGAKAERHEGERPSDPESRFRVTLFALARHQPSRAGNDAPEIGHLSFDASGPRPTYARI
jgi:hypothetical protein